MLHMRKRGRRCVERDLSDIAIIGGGDQRLRHRPRRRRAAALSVYLVRDERPGRRQRPPRSTKLIHGGLRYLEYYEFRAGARSAGRSARCCSAHRAAHHPAHALRAAASQRGLRPAWLLRLGLFLYDHLGGRKRLPATRRRRPDARSGRQAAEAALSTRLSSIPIAGSTMRGWWS